ncbi:MULTISPECIES: DUF2680 domain-containing protein [Paenibacillus]|uniref:Uncharacterized protein n=1 Tax=Paenibacillus naphthalenovorans TaxID=162209 RepID=A0A0U2L2U3_9BACL|nr:MULTISPECIES: DUF2680 domain-containing protein [Paenibacillus]ALS24098.1 hypothetical protein IJ22_37600 [Paenibacillus naphthalenovorans]GCL72315.1 DUF2680 domain-containing protein [Paenibacillus naphthalenovorans]SDJ20925.1 Protein of unknown function [Paenibacillus naphthalenovorans]
MKTIGKKMVAGTIIASFVLGVGFVGTLHNQAFANESAGAKIQKPDFGSGWGDKGRGKINPGGLRGGHVLQETATILGVEQSVITDAMKEGKTLLQIAQEKGLSEEDYLQKLVDVQTAAIDAQVTAGTLTQEQADQMKSGLSDRLKQQIENKGFGHPGEDRGKMPFGPMGNPEALTQILGVTQEELATELQAGKSLAEFAESKGITKEELVSKIKDSMTEQLNQFVDQKGGWHGKAKSASDAAASSAEAVN